MFEFLVTILLVVIIFVCSPGIDYICFLAFSISSFEGVIADSLEAKEAISRYVLYLACQFSVSHV